MTKLLVSDSLLSCRFCETPFISEALLTVHELFCVNNRMTKAQKQNFDGMERIIVVFKERLVYLCQYCLFKSAKSNIFNKHMNKHSREGKLYICKMCNVDLYNPYDMANHFQLLHPDQEPYQCPRCSFTTDKVSLIRMHWKIHYYYRCEFCPFKTHRFVCFRYHRTTHVYRKFQCKVHECIYSCDSREALKNHKTEHHKSKSESGEGFRFQKPDQNCNTDHSDIKIVEVFTKEENVSDCEDSVAEGHSHVSHGTSCTEVDRFSRSVELYDKINNSDVSEQVEEDRKDDLSNPLISNNEISSTLMLRQQRQLVHKR